MIDHLGFSVSDYERAKAFYAKALAPLDYSLSHGGNGGADRPRSAAGFGANGKPDLWFGAEGAMNKPAAYRDSRQGPRHGRCLLQGGDCRRRPRQRRTRYPPALSCELLRRVRARP